MVMLCGERPLDGVPDGGGGGPRRWSYGRGSERQKRADCVVSYHHPLTRTRLPFTQRRRRSVERMAMRLMVLLAALLVALLASAGYAARNTHLMKHWHPMLVEPALGYFGLSFFGHEHNTRVYRVEDGSFVEAPVTSCWDYDFLERDCDGPDHYKAYLADGRAPDSKLGAYMGDRGNPRTSPPRAKACAVNQSPYRRYCVSDYLDDGKTVWRDTGHDLERHTLVIGCPGPRLEYPCGSKDP